MKPLLTLFYFFIFLNYTFAQFPPAAGEVGSTAISAEDSRFVNWAKTCVIERGFLDISQPDLGIAGTGFEEAGIGIADNDIASLGDGGIATLTFDPPIRNGIGWDFAVFENGFLQGQDAYFLELAFVEVSSDGENFVRFPAISLVQDTVESGGFSVTDPQKIHNLAGKYVVGEGTPFDLEELENEPNLDVQNVTHIRLIDVVGTINENYASFDSEGNKINDPYPTIFPSGGFDLDAVGVIKEFGATTSEDFENQGVRFSPNPVKSGAKLFFEYGNIEIEKVVLSDLNGRQISIFKSENVSLPALKKGIYLLYFYSGRNVLVERMLVF